MKNLFLLLSLFSLSVTSAFATEELEYVVLSEEKTFEIREYVPHVTASVLYNPSKGETMNDAFMVLFNYISGANKTKSKIAMTAPVFDGKSTKIAMTAPVFDQGKDGLRKMSFTIPAKYTFDTVPRPTDSRVILEQIPRRLMAANQFSWFAGDTKKSRKAEELKTWLATFKDDYKIISGPIYAGYDAPLTLPFLKRHEMLFLLEEL